MKGLYSGDGKLYDTKTGMVMVEGSFANGELVTEKPNADNAGGDGDGSGGDDDGDGTVNDDGSGGKGKTR